MVKKKQEKNVSYYIFYNKINIANTMPFERFRMIKILDCTLRDGGYINKWEFGENSIKNIYENIQKSQIDYIEAGFLKDVIYNPNCTLYDEIEKLNIFKTNEKTKLCVMLMSDEFDVCKIPKKTPDINLDCIRYVFKKEQLNKGVNEILKIKDSGYEISMNPSNVDTYSDSEFLALINTANKIKPEIFCIVDTKGVLREKDVKRLYKIIQENLDENIITGFHSHNNLQLSFLNAKYLIKNAKRDLIIDSCIFGMGRGAGNLPTELLIQYINENYDGKYNIIPILKIIDEQINPIFARTPWGYSIPYYLAAINHCHPNYAKYLIDKRVPVEVIDKLLFYIPEDKKTNYDEKLIEQIYQKNL